MVLPPRSDASLSDVESWADSQGLKVFNKDEKPLADEESGDLTFFPTKQGIVILGPKKKDPSEIVDYITKGGDLEGTKWKNAPFVGGRLKDTLESVFGDKKIGEVMKGVSALSLLCTTDWSESVSKFQRNISTAYSGLSSNVSRYPVASSLLAAAAIGLYAWGTSTTPDAGSEESDDLTHGSLFDDQDPYADTARRTTAPPSTEIRYDDKGVPHVPGRMLGLNTEGWVPITTLNQSQSSEGREAASTSTATQHSKPQAASKHRWKQPPDTVSNLTRRTSNPHGMLGPLTFGG